MSDRRYLIVAGACLTQFTTVGLLFSYGLYLPELEAEFGWSRTLMSAATSVAFLMMGVLAIPLGRLIDRLGPRRVMTVTGLAYGCGYALLSLISAPWQLFTLFATLMALGLATHDVGTLSTVARWFENRRGIMSGVVKVGTALGQIAVPPVAAALIVWGGWRQSLVILGLGAALALVGGALLMRAPPRKLDSTGAAAVEDGTDYGVARRDRKFWTMAVAQFLFFPSLTTVPLHLAVHGQDLGLTPTRAATLLSAIGLASIAGRLVVGGAVDRIGGRRAYLICLAALAVSHVLFAVTSAPVILFAVTLVYGFGHGGLFTVVSPTVAEYFGMRAHGAIFGTVVFFGTLGGAVGPILAGMAFDQTGSYLPAFITLGLAAAVAFALILSLPRPERAPAAA